MESSPPVSTLSAPAPVRPRACLGLMLATREVGAVVATREILLDFTVINLRRLRTPAEKEERFRGTVLRLLDREPCTRIALLQPAPLFAHRPLVRALDRWLHEEARRRNLPLAHYERQAVKSFLVGTSAPARPTWREVSSRLARRYPNVASYTWEGMLPARGHLAPQPMLPPPYVSPRERYWSRMFLALAAAVYDLDQQALRSALGLHPHPYEPLPIPPTPSPHQA